MSRRCVGWCCVAALACARESSTQPATFDGAARTTGNLASPALAPAASPAPPALHAAAALAPVPVRWFGALHELMHGQTAGRVQLRDAALGQLSLGVGALEGLGGEITLLGGRVWLARAAGGRVVLQSGNVHEVGAAAALLVVGEVEHWQSAPLGQDVPPERLDDVLEARLVAAGFSPDAVAPLVVRGGIATLRGHVLDGSALPPGSGHSEHARLGVGIDLSEPSGDTTLVGFYSRHHAGTFTHMGERSHLHMVNESLGQSGHVDAVSLRADAELRLPAR